jgi:hypothetical protein
MVDSRGWRNVGGCGVEGFEKVWKGLGTAEKRLGLDF